MERRALRIKDVEWQRGPGESVWFEIHVNPLVNNDNGLVGVSIVFHDVTAARKLLDELEHTNRQLESAYEELQSTNDELQAINDTLRERSAELDEVKDFLESILGPVRPGVVVLDLEMRILVWNRGAQDLWGLRRDEAAGEHLLNLDIGLPVSELRASVRNAMSDPAFEDTLTLDAVNRRGRQTRIRIAVGALRRPDNGTTEGAILVMEPIENTD
ncbi:PAS domain S-box-containing protein [Kibdelosporangium banguiense]|uniref:PAS domain S-box-containing protein n=1 Tax=Kibdelosporangium banguiense TaxID=1365924 RepID=A0ABS4U1Y3_9PSEU|nr:PAS domain S-box-containing protein [Kibdelosporangium banguiense]